MADRVSLPRPVQAVRTGAAKALAHRTLAHRSRLFPRGPVDLVLQLALIAAAYTAWRHARGLADGDTAASLATSLAHARELIDLERSVGLLFEPSLQGWAVGSGWPADVARWGYSNLHFNLSCLALVTIYYLWPASFAFVRNMVLAAMAISLLGYVLYPTAPPRFIPEMGLDPSPSVTGNEPLVLFSADPLYNPFAAVPSMHVGLAIVFASSLALLTPRRPLRVVLLAYPLLMTYVVIASGNHFWIDAVLGAAAAALAAGVAALLARMHPAWSFRATSERPVTPAPEVEPVAA